MLPVATAIKRQSKFSRQKLTHAYYAFASYVRREGHLYEVFLVLAKARFKRRAIAVPNKIDRIKFDLISTAVARRLKPSRATRQ